MADWAYTTVYYDSKQIEDCLHVGWTLEQYANGCGHDSTYYRELVSSYEHQMENEFDRKYYETHPVNTRNFIALAEILEERERKKREEETKKREQQDAAAIAGSHDIFSDDAIIYETVGGVSINQETGEWSFHEFTSADNFLKNFGEYEGAVEAFGNMIRKNKANVSESNGQVTATEDDSESGFDENGTLKTKKYTCPYCKKKVDQLNKNGYCSKACATYARAAKAQAKVSAAGNKTLEIIGQVKDKLAMLDTALNLIEALPDIIRQKAKLPEVYREYITLRIDEIFIRLKMFVNLIMIQKNELLLQVMRKLKTGALDDVMMKIFQPIQTVIQVAAAIQQALNAAVEAIMALLSAPGTGMEPQSYAFMMTAKSAQVGQYAGKMIIPIEPKANIASVFASAMNCIPYEKIDDIVKKALPPIQEFEYFLPPDVFKVRFQLSQDNGPRVKKAWEILEAIMKFSAECFPRYKDLKLSNPWYVLAILTGWGPVSRQVYGDFIFHGPI